MIISASRRTDIPAFFSGWLINRIREGYCSFVNPFNSGQVSKVSLSPADVDLLVFWTRNPKPLIPYLTELDKRGFKYFFHFTLTGYPKVLEPNLPHISESTGAFRKLSQIIGPAKVIWRYDPILLSSITHVEFHLANFQRLAKELSGYTNQVKTSLVDPYRKAKSKLRDLAKVGVIVDEHPGESLAQLLAGMVDIANDAKITISSCAEGADFGVKQGRCIDPDYLRDVFGLDFGQAKDPNQRAACGCIPSKDIGMYNTCLHGCSYCYAGTLAGARRNWKRHLSCSPSLLGNYLPAEK